MSSGVTLSSATRSNLLALQNTADLVSTTQNRLSTGKKVNSAIDNASNFFTASSLSSRSSSLSTLLDGISNGIQTIQAANQGITSIQKLTSQLKSTAQQALASSNSFTAKATSATSALTGVTGASLLGPNATVSSSAAVGNSTTSPAATTGTVALTDSAIATEFASADKAITVDGVAITLDHSAISNQTTLKSAINLALTNAGSSARVDFDASNHLKVLAGGGSTTPPTVAGTDVADFFGATPVKTGISPTTGASLATDLGFAANDTFKVNGYTVTVGATTTIDQLTSAIGSQTGGAVTATFDASTRKFALTSKDVNTSIVLANGSTGTSLVAKLGLTAGTTTANSALNGKTLSVAVGTGALALSKTISFGTGANQVSTLDQLNAALSSVNAQATVDSTTGAISVTTTNEAGAENLGLSGTATGSGNPFLTTAASATLGGDGKTSRDKLVTDYNNLLTQIDQLSADAGFNGVNLLKGDTVKVIFNEKNTSSVSIKGVATDSSTLGLNNIGSTDFQDATTINSVLDKISSANSTLESQAATFGTNLSVVQNRQDFSKSLINILDTGAANLTDADLNEEAANSQALTTRQSLGVSALSLANQAQQGILQLLR